MKYLQYLTIKKLLLIVTAILLFLVFFRLANDLSFPDTDWLIGKDDKIELKDNKKLLQKFTADRDGLSKIEVLLGSAKIKGSIKMELLDENCEKSLRKSELRTSKLDSDKTYAFKFSQVNDSKNKTFCFLISSEAEKTGSKYPSVFITNSPAPSGGMLIEPDFMQSQEKSLSIRPSYENTLVWQDASELNRRISQYKPFFLKHYYLWAIAISFIILSIVLIVILIL